MIAMISISIKGINDWKNAIYFCLVQATLEVHYGPLILYADTFFSAKKSRKKDTFYPDKSQSIFELANDTILFGMKNISYL